MKSNNIKKYINNSAAIALAISPSITLANAPSDDIFLKCDMMLVAIETSIKQKIRNALEEGPDDVTIGYTFIVPDKAIDLPEMEHHGEAYPDKIEFKDFNPYSIDRVSLVMTYEDISGKYAAINRNESIIDEDYKNLTRQCAIISEYEMTEIIKKHNRNIGGVKF